MDKGSWAIGAACLVVGFAIGAAAGNHYAGRHAEAQVETITRIDTLRDTVPTYIRETHVQTVERVLRVVDTLKVIRTDTIITLDSVAVEVPITQKLYTDSLYTAWVSGYEARLDSIDIITQTTERVQPSPSKRWGVSLYGGCGTDFQHGVKPQVGVGLTYALFLF